MKKKEAGVIGLGYVGIPLAAAMVDAGYEVIGVDVNDKKVKKLRCGISYLTDISDQRVAKLLESGFKPTTQYEELSDTQFFSICVPTPVSETGQPDTSYIIEAVEKLSEVISNGSVVILESTVYPGATKELVASKLSDSGFEVGDDVYVAHSPERIDPGNKKFDHTKIPKVTGGITSKCGEISGEWYETIFDEVVRVNSAMEAEMTKILENTFRSVNIGLINEFAKISNEMGVDIWQVIKAASTKPFGFMPFYPGPGVGGHCIPTDPLLLSWKAQEQDHDTELIDLALQINEGMSDYVIKRIVNSLNKKGETLPESVILIVGVAYKPGVRDTRKSPAYDIIKKLTSYGAEIKYHDPYVPQFTVNGKNYHSKDISSDLMRDIDCCVIVTDHPEVNINFIIEESDFVFDTRNATGKNAPNNVEKL